MALRCFIVHWKFLERWNCNYKMWNNDSIWSFKGNDFTHFPHFFQLIRSSISYYMAFDLISNRVWTRLIQKHVNYQFWEGNQIHAENSRLYTFYMDRKIYMLIAHWRSHNFIYSYIDISVRESGATDSPAPSVYAHVIALLTTSFTFY